MRKVRQKISGCFRTSLGAKEVRPGVMEATRSVFSGERIMPMIS
jgi:hypothetical protein